jgi:hypothetical protein
MPTNRHLNEKKTPMNSTTVTDIATTAPRSSAMSLINEALSRARMRSPQRSEARRSARRIAMQARKQQAREMGTIAQTFSVR